METEEGVRVRVCVMCWAQRSCDLWSCTNVRITPCHRLQVCITYIMCAVRLQMHVGTNLQRWGALTPQAARGCGRR